MSWLRRGVLTTRSRHYQRLNQPLKSRGSLNQSRSLKPSRSLKQGRSLRPSQSL
jgi:hypothetical protein